jgi:hypothetical protein
MSVGQILSARIGRSPKDVIVVGEVEPDDGKPYNNPEQDIHVFVEVNLGSASSTAAAIALKDEQPTAIIKSAPPRRSRCPRPRSSCV